MTFDLPAQPLVDVLTEFCQQTGVQVLFHSDERRKPRVHGGNKHRDVLQTLVPLLRGNEYLRVITNAFRSKSR